HVRADVQPEPLDYRPHRLAGAKGPVPGDQRQHDLGTGQRRRAKERMDVAAEAAARDQRQALAVLRELVGELHRDAAAERMADRGPALVAKNPHQVADPAGVGAEGVVPARLRGPAVPEEVRRDDGVAVSEAADHAKPDLRARRDAVHEHNEGSVAGPQEADLVAVQRYLLELALGAGAGFGGGV